jgi:hypothetical protein
MLKRALVIAEFRTDRWWLKKTIEPERIAGVPPPTGLTPNICW